MGPIRCSPHIAALTLQFVGRCAQLASVARAAGWAAACAAGLAGWVMGGKPACLALEEKQQQHSRQHLSPSGSHHLSAAVMR